MNQVKFTYKGKTYYCIFKGETRNYYTTEGRSVPRTKYLDRALELEMSGQKKNYKKIVFCVLLVALIWTVKEKYTDHFEETKENIRIEQMSDLESNAKKCSMILKDKYWRSNKLEVATILQILKTNSPLLLKDALEKEGDCQELITYIKNEEMLKGLLVPNAYSLVYDEIAQKRFTQVLENYQVKVGNFKNVAQISMDYGRDTKVVTKVTFALESKKQEDSKDAYLYCYYNQENQLIKMILEGSFQKEDETRNVSYSYDLTDAFTKGLEENATLNQDFIATTLYEHTYQTEAMLNPYFDIFTLYDAIKNCTSEKEMKSILCGERKVL